MRFLKKTIQKVSQWNQRKLLFALLILVECLIVIIPVTFTWLSSNNRVQSRDMAVSGGYLPRITYRRADQTDDDWQELTDGNPVYLTDAVPGSYTDLLVRVENIGRAPFTVDSLGFLAPSEEEEKQNSQGLYLGTQLYAFVTRVRETAASENRKYLATITEDTLSRHGVELFSSAGTKKQGSGEPFGKIRLEMGNSITFTIRIVFENRDEPQDGFKHFGEDGDGCCARRIYVECNE